MTNTLGTSAVAARALARSWKTSAPSARQAVLRVMTMLRRPGSGRPMESQVLRPMMTGQPSVVRLKNFRSSGRRHSRALSLPMAPLRATAAMSESVRDICRAPSDRHRGLDGRVVGVFEHLEVFVFVVEDRRRLALDVEHRVGGRRAAELQLDLLGGVRGDGAVTPPPAEGAP